MATRTEPRSRLPAWLAVTMAGIGVALGLWQVGIFERPAAPVRGVSGDDASVHAGTQRGRPADVASAVGINTSTAVADGPATAGPATHLEQLANDVDPEEQAESAALLDALAAEQANNP